MVDFPRTSGSGHPCLQPGIKPKLAYAVGFHLEVTENPDQTEQPQTIWDKTSFLNFMQRWLGFNFHDVFSFLIQGTLYQPKMYL